MVSMAVLNVNVLHRKYQAPFATPKRREIKAGTVWSRFPV